MNKQTENHSITSATVLTDLAEKEKAAIEQISSTTKVAPGTKLTSEGSIGREFGVVLSGTATVMIGDTQVAQLKSGDHYGEIALLAGVGSDGANRTATVTTDTEVWVSVMSRQEFSSLKYDFPDVLDTIRAGASDRVRANALG